MQHTTRDQLWIRLVDFSHSTPIIVGLIAGGFYVAHQLILSDESPKTKKQLAGGILLAGLSGWAFYKIGIYLGFPHDLVVVLAAILASTGENGYLELQKRAQSIFNGGQK